MLRPDEPTAASSMVGSVRRMSFAASVATRPYSAAVLLPICHGPSTSFPRHQNLTAWGFSQPCSRRRSESWVPDAMVAVFDQAPRIVRPARAEIDRQHRLDVREPAPVDELVGAERIRLERQPGELHAARALLDRADAVLPIVAGDEVPAGIAHDRSAPARARARARRHESLRAEPSDGRARRCRHRRTGRDARRTRRTAAGRSFRSHPRGRAALSRHALLFAPSLRMSEIVDGGHWRGRGRCRRRLASAASGESTEDLSRIE